MAEMQHYVLFPNHENGMKLYRLLKEKGIKTQISPTPRAASKCCGISLLVREEEKLASIRECIEEHEIEIIDIVSLEKDMNKMRDKYC